MSGDKISWKPATVKLKQLTPWEHNPKTISKAHAKRLLENWEQMGQWQTIAIDAGFTVADGHQRLNVLKAAYGVEYEIKVLQADRELTDSERKRIVIEGHAGAVGSWDWDVLSGWEPAELNEFGFDRDLLKDWKRDIAGLDTFIKSEQEDPTDPTDAEPQIDRAAELQEKWKTETGQLWRIGDHRLLCGDSAKREDVERVMGGEKARMCFTSPPYGNVRDYELGEFDFMALYKGFSDNAFLFCDDILVNLGLIHKDGSVFRYWDEWLDYCRANGNELFGWYVWDQGQGMPGDFHGRLARSHEWIFHFSKTHKTANKWIVTSGESLKRGIEGKKFRQKDGSMKELGSPDTIGQLYKIPDSVVRIGRENARGVHTENHPAVFPVELPTFIIKTWSDDNDIIYEPFCGSGTTMLACQNLSRKCRAIEISPNYCAVIMERMTTAFPDIEIELLP